MYCEGLKKKWGQAGHGDRQEDEETGFIPTLS